MTGIESARDSSRRSLGQLSSWGLLVSFMGLFLFWAVVRNTSTLSSSSDSSPNVNMDLSSLFSALKVGWYFLLRLPQRTDPTSTSGLLAANKDDGKSLYSGVVPGTIRSSMYSSSVSAQHSSSLITKFS